MNKVEAAEFLEIGVRSLERYMSQNRIAYTRVRGKTGEVVGVTVQKKIISTRLAET